MLAAFLIALKGTEIRHNPVALVASLRTSTLYVLLDWTIVAVILLAVYLISSLEETGPLLRASLLASVPAMWFAPAILLIRAPTPLLILIGLLLIANSVRVLISRGLSRREYLAPGSRRYTPRLLSYRHYGRISPSYSRETTTVILGALAFQLAIVAIWTGYELTSAFLFGTGATIWTLTAISRGVFQPRRKVDSFTTAGLTLVLAILISASQDHSDTLAVSDPNLPQFTQLGSFQVLPRPSTPLRKKNVTRVFTGATAIPPASRMVVDGVEGVILRPEIIPPRLTLSVSRKSGRPSSSPPSGFRFTGEYQLFPLSSRDLKKDWSVQTGTPVDSVYATISGRPLQTEAYQALVPPVDFTRVHKLQLTLVSHEGVPVAATVQLIANRSVPALGPEIFGLGQSREETIDFSVPDSLDGLQVTAIRIIFSCIASQCNQSIRVAVQEFRLVTS